MHLVGFLCRKIMQIISNNLKEALIITLMQWVECMVHHHSLVVIMLSLVGLAAKIKVDMVDRLVGLVEHMVNNNNNRRCRAKCMVDKVIIRIKILVMETKWALIILLVMIKNGKRQKFLLRRLSEWLLMPNLDPMMFANMTVIPLMI